MTASKPDTALPVNVHGGLRLDGPSGHPVKLNATGSRLQLAARSWAELRQLGPRSLRAKRRSLLSAIRALNLLGLSLDVTIDGRRRFGFGKGVKTTLFARLLGLRSADVRVSNILSLLRSWAA